MVAARWRPKLGVGRRKPKTALYAGGPRRGAAFRSHLDAEKAAKEGEEMGLIGIKPRLFPQGISPDFLKKVSLFFRSGCPD